MAALNTDAAHASLALCAMVFRTALLERADAADIGVPTLPLGELHGDGRERYLTAHGAKVLHAHRRSARSARSDEGFEVALDGDAIAAEVVVVAAPPEATAAMLPDGALAHPERLAELGGAPIVNVHAVYDRPGHRRTVHRGRGFAGAVGVRPDRDRRELADGGQYLAVSLSAAEQWIDTPTARLRDVFLPEMARLFPAAATGRGHEVLRHP